MNGPEKRIDPRRHISERVNRARLQLEIKRSLQPLVVILIGVGIGVGGFIYIADHIGAGAGAKRTVRFAAKDTTGLVPGRAEVRFKGIPAGIVKKVDIEHNQAVVTVSVLKKYGPIYRDARTMIRPNTPLQDMYLDIVDRGTKAAGPAGNAVLPASQSNTSVNISAVLDTFSPDVRSHLTSLMAELGEGLKDRGAKLRESFVELAPFINVLGKLSRQLAIRSDRTQRMVHNVGQLTKVLAARDSSLRGLVSDGNRVLSATADQRAGLDGTLRELPLTLRSLDSSFATVRGVLPDLNEAVERLNPVASQLGPGLDALQGVSRDAKPAVDALQTPVGALVPLSRDLKPLAGSLSQSIQALLPQMPDVARITKDVAGCPLAAYMFFQWTASITKFDDAMGAYPTGDFGFGADSLSGVKDPGRYRSPSCAPGQAKGATP